MSSHQPQVSPQLPWLQPLQTSQQIKSKKYQLLLTIGQNTQEATKIPLVHHANTLFQPFHPLGRKHYNCSFAHTVDKDVHPLHTTTSTTRGSRLTSVLMQAKLSAKVGERAETHLQRLACLQTQCRCQGRAAVNAVNEIPMTPHSSLKDKSGA